MNWPVPPPIRVPHAAAPLTMDGRLDEPAWTNAATFTGLYRFNSRGKLSGPATTWKILWDETYLYFAFDCADRDIVAPKRKRDDTVFMDDCVEMFILPEFRFRTYWELVVSPGGDIFDSVDCKQADQWGAILDLSQDLKGLKCGIEVRGTLNKQDDVDQGYTIEIAVPFAELPGYSRAAPQAGQRLHFMLVRLDRNGKTFTPYACQPLLGWGHNIWNMGVMELEGPSATRQK